MKTTIGLLAATLFLVGCASQGTHSQDVLDYEYDEAKSPALNITEAAGIVGLSDIPREDYEALVEENPELADIDPRHYHQDHETINMIGAAGAGLAGLESPVLGLGSLATGAMGVISWLTAPPPLLKDAYIVIWLPEGDTLKDFWREYAKDNEQLWSKPLRYAMKPQGTYLKAEDFELPAAKETPEFLDSSDRSHGPIFVSNQYYLTKEVDGEEVKMNPHEVNVSVANDLPGYGFTYMGADGPPRVYNPEGVAMYLIEPPQD